MTEASSAFADFLLAQIRVAAARARLAVVEIDSIGTALAGNFISADDAIAWMDEIGATITLPSTKAAA